MKGSTARKVDQPTDAQGEAEDDFLEGLIPCAPQPGLHENH